MNRKAFLSHLDSLLIISKSRLFVMTITNSVSLISNVILSWKKYVYEVIVKGSIGVLLMILTNRISI